MFAPPPPASQCSTASRLRRSMSAYFLNLPPPSRLHRRHIMKAHTMVVLNLAVVALSVGQAGAVTSSTGPYSPPTYQPKFERPQPPTTYTPKVERPEPPRTYTPSGPTFSNRR